MEAASIKNIKGLKNIDDRNGGRQTPNFLTNLRVEMELFHSQLNGGEGLEIVAICYNGDEISVERIIPVPPDMLVCECRNGDRLVQHVNSVQLRFHRTFTNTEFIVEDKGPIGFRSRNEEGVENVS